MNPGGWSSPGKANATEEESSCNCCHGKGRIVQVQDKVAVMCPAFGANMEGKAQLGFFSSCLPALAQVIHSSFPFAHEAGHLRTVLS